MESEETISERIQQIRESSEEINRRLEALEEGSGITPQTELLRQLGELLDNMADHQEGVRSEQEIRDRLDKLWTERFNASNSKEAQRKAILIAELNWVLKEDE